MSGPRYVDGRTFAEQYAAALIRLAEYTERHDAIPVSALHVVFTLDAEQGYSL